MMHETFVSGEPGAVHVSYEVFSLLQVIALFVESFELDVSVDDSLADEHLVVEQRYVEVGRRRRKGHRRGGRNGRHW